jgi:hypothetical protein
MATGRDVRRSRERLLPHIHLESESADAALERVDALRVVRRRPDGAAPARPPLCASRGDRGRVDPVHVPRQTIVPAVPPASAWRPKRSRWP